MKANGEFTDNKIIIHKSKDVGRFFNKSHLGKTIAGNRLELSLLEGVFLIGEEKLRVYHDEKEISFQELLKIASKKISNFEIKYLIFNDLRKRGNNVQTCKKNEIFDFYIDKKNCYISAFYERNIIDIDRIQKLIENSKRKNKLLWFAVVDEEGDITFYEVNKTNIKGKIRDHKFLKTSAMLLDNSVIVTDKKTASELFNKEFFGKPFGDLIQLSMVESLYLMQKKIIELRNAKNDKKISLRNFIVIIKKAQPEIESILAVFKDLKKRGLIVKTGFKFGAHFRGYTKKPEETHAEYLIHVVNKKYRVIWAEISRAVRLAHSVNKEIIFAKFEGKNIEYIKFGRLRP